MKYNETNSVTENIVVFYNLNTFMKVKPDAFDIGKLLISFGEMDANKKLVPGKSIDYYLDVKNTAMGKNAHVLCQDILSGKINKLMDAEEKKRLGKVVREMSDAEKAAIPDNKKYAQAVLMYQGGQNADKAKRNDGKALAKILKITRGSKKPVIFSCEEGPGNVTKEGLIVPAYNGKPEKIIRVSMSNDDLKTFAIMVQEAYSAWLTARYFEKGSTPNNTIQNAQWIRNDKGFFICSNCKKEAEFAFEHIEHNRKKIQSLSKFCPHCGCGMNS